MKVDLGSIGPVDGEERDIIVEGPRFKKDQVIISGAAIATGIVSITVGIVKLVKAAFRNGANSAMSEEYNVQVDLGLIQGSEKIDDGDNYLDFKLK